MYLEMMELVKWRHQRVWAIQIVIHLEVMVNAQNVQVDFISMHWKFVWKLMKVVKLSVFLKINVNNVTLDINLVWEVSV